MIEWRHLLIDLDIMIILIYFYKVRDKIEKLYFRDNFDFFFFLKRTILTIEIKVNGLN